MLPTKPTFCLGTRRSSSANNALIASSHCTSSKRHDHFPRHSVASQHISSRCSRPTTSLRVASKDSDLKTQAERFVESLNELANTQLDEDDEPQFDPQQMRDRLSAIKEKVGPRFLMKTTCIHNPSNKGRALTSMSGMVNVESEKCDIGSKHIIRLLCPWLQLCWDMLHAWPFLYGRFA